MPEPFIAHNTQQRLESHYKFLQHINVALNGFHYPHLDSSWYIFLTAISQKLHGLFMLGDQYREEVPAFISLALDF